VGDFTNSWWKIISKAITREWISCNCQSVYSSNSLLRHVAMKYNLWHNSRRNSTHPLPWAKPERSRTCNPPRNSNKVCPFDRVHSACCCYEFNVICNDWRITTQHSNWAQATDGTLYCHQRKTTQRIRSCVTVGANQNNLNHEIISFRISSQSKSTSVVNNLLSGPC